MWLGIDSGPDAGHFLQFDGLQWGCRVPVPQLTTCGPKSGRSAQITPASGNAESRRIEPKPVGEQLVGMLAQERRRQAVIDRRGRAIPAPLRSNNRIDSRGGTVSAKGSRFS
jgi:hypothetical protein